MRKCEYVYASVWCRVRVSHQTTRLSAHSLSLTDWNLSGSFFYSNPVCDLLYDAVFASLTKPPASRPNRLVWLSGIFLALLVFFSFFRLPDFSDSPIHHNCSVTEALGQKDRTGRTPVRQKIANLLGIQLNTWQLKTRNSTAKRK